MLLAKIHLPANSHPLNLEGVLFLHFKIERQQVVNTDPTANIDAKVVEVKVKLDKESSQRVAGLTNLLVNVQIEIWVASSKFLKSTTKRQQTNKSKHDINQLTAIAICLNL